jgi:hypothetical protein
MMSNDLDMTKIKALAVFSSQFLSLLWKGLIYTLVDAFNYYNKSFLAC